MQGCGPRGMELRIPDYDQWKAVPHVISLMSSQMIDQETNLALANITTSYLIGMK